MRQLTIMLDAPPARNTLCPYSVSLLRFDDDVGMIAKRTAPFPMQDLLSLENSPVGLIDDLAEDTHCPFKSPGEFLSREGIGERKSLHRRQSSEIASSAYPATSRAYWRSR